MNRGELTNLHGERLQPLLPPQKPTIGRPAQDHPTSLHGLRWLLRTGAPWRDWPARYGPWRTVASRCSRWQRAGVFPHLVATLQQQAEAAGPWAWTLHVVERTRIRAPQPAAGATNGPQRPKPSGAAQAAFVPPAISGPRARASPGPSSSRLGSVMRRSSGSPCGPKAPGTVAGLAAPRGVRNGSSALRPLAAGRCDTTCDDTASA